MAENIQKLEAGVGARGGGGDVGGPAGRRGAGCPERRAPRLAHPSAQSRRTRR